MSNIPSANQKIQVEPTQYRAPVSESLLQTIGGSVNYALDEVAANAASISSVSGTLAALTTQLNSSADCVKTVNAYDTLVNLLGDNSIYADGVLIQRDTLTIPQLAGHYWFLYFSSDRVDTTRKTSYIKITLANDPDFGATVLYDGSNNLTGFAAPLTLPPGTGNFTVYVDLYAGVTFPVFPAQRNRWNYRLQGRQYNPAAFIIP